METQKKRRGDRKDGRLMRELDSLHYVTGILYPNRCDNEAYISQRIDLTNMNAYIAKKNETETEFPYTMFHLVLTALMKTITLRPKLNRFIVNKNTYQRNEVSAAFVIKKIFSDGGAEGLAFIHTGEGDNLDAIHDEIYRQVSACRDKNLSDSSSDSMDILNKMPRFLSKFLLRIICFLDRHGWVPNFLIAADPYYSSVVFTNLGSIQLHSGYHHLTNWGTNSLFVAIGEMKKRPFFEEDGSMTMRDSIDLGLTIDERLADGYYYSKTVRLVKKLLECPELLELPFSQEIEY